MWLLFKKREVGTLKFYNVQKGFGFASCPNGPDIRLTRKTFKGRVDKTEFAKGAKISFKASAKVPKGKTARDAATWSMA
ncbi:cold-shock protein [bacterium]|nr:cold-shock protein [bacterium]